MTQPTLSLIVPSRGRVAQFANMLDSLARRTRRPEAVEVVLVVDEDDEETRLFRHPAFSLKQVVGPPGRTMGALNRAGEAAAAGEYLMLLNDDVIARTPGWDEKILRRLQRFPDGVVLVHVNDTLMGHHLCTFPAVSRAFCDLAGGICPAEYNRYRIDDHVEDVFNLLGVLGCPRSIYLPDVIFEHTNAVRHADGTAEARVDPELQALDAPRFLDFFPARKELALKLLAHIEGPAAGAREAGRRQLLESLIDPFALRVPGRLRVERDWSPPRRWLRSAARWLARWGERGCACWQRKGARGLARAVIRRLAVPVGS
jgi:hypothetical protein